MTTKYPRPRSYPQAPYVRRQYPLVTPATLPLIVLSALGLIAWVGAFAFEAGWIS